MKILKIKCNSFKGARNIDIDFVAKSKLSSTDKMYEVVEILPNLFIHNTVMFIGNNAGGKSTIIDLVSLCVLMTTNDSSIDEVDYILNNTILEIIFVNDIYIYKYIGTLNGCDYNNKKIKFSDEKIYKKKYLKTKNNNFDFNKNDSIGNLSSLPVGTSAIFHIMKEINHTSNEISSVCDYSIDKYAYNSLFKTIKKHNVDIEVLDSIIRIFDPSVKRLTLNDNGYFTLVTEQKNLQLRDYELFSYLSKGTSRGITLYIYAVICLETGGDLIVDELENHFHKALIINLFLLFKDNNVNKKGARLIFSTHYFELLETFSRRDNIYICKKEDYVKCTSLYDYKIRSDFNKLRLYNNKDYNTNVDYEALMKLKRVLIEWNIL